jgi:hypothetical protein
LGGKELATGGCREKTENLNFRERKCLIIIFEITPIKTCFGTVISSNNWKKLDCVLGFLIYKVVDTFYKIQITTTTETTTTI